MPRLRGRALGGRGDARAARAAARHHRRGGRRPLLPLPSRREHGSWRLGERARLYPHRYREIEVRPLPADSSRVLVSHAAAGELPESVAELGGALGRKSLLPRGGDPRPDRARRPRAPERRLAAGGRRRRAGHSGGRAGPLQARLDRLDPETREILSLAAVIGRTFGLPLLERLVPRRADARAHRAHALDLIVEKRRRVRIPSTGSGTASSRRSRTRASSTRRRKLHKRVGEALEEIYASRRRRPGLLARRGGRRPRRSSTC